VGQLHALTRFTSGERAHYRCGRWVGPRAFLDAVAKTVPAPVGNRTPVVGHHSDRVVPVPNVLLLLICCGSLDGSHLRVFSVC
jgi:hypothetical protein